MEDLLSDVKQSAHNLLDIREWKERLSPYEALKIGVEIQRNRLLQEALTTIEPGSLPAQRINLIEKITASFDDIAKALRDKNM